MQDTDEARGRLIRAFAENDMEKLFYFCLKKTGSYPEAEDLTQDIAIQIIAALSKGVVPANFSAWVWQIARNRYSAWAKEKHRRRETAADADIGDYEIPGDGESMPDAIIHAEQLALLRRELAFIKRDYRSIVAAYYIECKNVREIAASLSLSVNTVKSRLLRAREILKEGMDMAREFGKRSYSPESVTFASSGNQSSGLPFSVVKRKIPQNILLEASNNPSTVEELSIELGIALPYMEEEVEILYKATLLEKQGNKYITNFFILDKDCRTEIYHALRKTSKERSRLLREFIDDSMVSIRALGIAGDHIEDNTIRWWLVPYLMDYLANTAQAEGTCNPPKRVGGESFCEPPKRANGESWGFVGYEATELPEKIIMGQNGCCIRQDEFWTYKCDDYSLWDQCGEPEPEEVELLCSCIRENRNIASFSEIEKRIWNKISGRYAHLSGSGCLIPDVLVIRAENLEKIHSYFRGHRNYAPLLANVAGLYEEVHAIFKKYSHPVLHKSIGYYIRMELCATRMMAIHDLVDDGFLQVPEDPDKSVLGMYILLK